MEVRWIRSFLLFSTAKGSLCQRECKSAGELVHRIVADRHSLIEAKRGDLKTSWDGLDIKGEWVVYR